MSTSEEVFRLATSQPLPVKKDAASPRALRRLAGISGEMLSRIGSYGSLQAVDWGWERVARPRYVW